MKPIKKPSLEKPIENAILTYLNLLPDCFAWKNNSVGVYDPIKKKYRKPKNKFLINGVSDIIGIYRGQPLFIEVKVPGKEVKGLTVDQKVFLSQIRRMGGIGFVATSIADVIKGLGASSE